MLPGKGKGNTQDGGQKPPPAYTRHGLQGQPQSANLSPPPGYSLTELQSSLYVTDTAW